MLKENSSNFPEKLPLDCYAKLVGHWLDCFLRNVTPSRLPASAMIRKALKLRICVLIKTSELLPVEVRRFISPLLFVGAFFFFPRRFVIPLRSRSSCQYP